MSSKRILLTRVFTAGVTSFEDILRREKIDIDAILGGINDRFLSWLDLVLKNYANVSGNTLLRLAIYSLSSSSIASSSGGAT